MARSRTKSRAKATESPAAIAPAQLASDKTYFTVSEMVRLACTLGEASADPVISRQMYSDVTTYPYYDALAMWLDTPQWMMLPYFRDICMDLLVVNRQRDRPTVLVDRVVGPRFRRYLRAREVHDTTKDMIVAKLSLLEASWL